MITHLTSQQLGSYLRQALAIVGIVFGVLTQSVTALHLPVAVSSVIAVAGAVILAVEHYVGDPSTGSSSPVPAPSGNAAPVSGNAPPPSPAPAAPHPSTGSSSPAPPVPAPAAPASVTPPPPPPTPTVIGGTP